MARRGKDERGDEGGLDDLFGEENFVEYDDSLNPFVAPPNPEPRRPFTAPVDIVRPAPDAEAGRPSTPDDVNLPPLPGEPQGPIHDRFSPTVAMPIMDDAWDAQRGAGAGPERDDRGEAADGAATSRPDALGEPAGPIHDRFSPTVAMPTVGAESADEDRPGATGDGQPSTRRELREREAQHPDAASASAYDDATVPLAAYGVAGAAAPDATTAATLAYTAPLPGEASASALPSTRAAASAPKGRLSAWWGRMSTPQRVRVCVAAGSLFVGLLVALFFLGRVIGAGTAAPAEDPAEPVASQLEPGVHHWTALKGGECLDPFTDAWADEFTVVDCAEPHAAQHLYRGEVGDEVTVYLDAEGWQGLTTPLCDGGRLFDQAAASEYTDLQWHITYPADVTAWANGDREYSCFVSRVAGEPIEGSLSAASTDTAE